MRLILVLLLMPLATSAATEKISAGDLKDLILKKNEKIQAKELERSAAASRQGRFARSFLPVIEIHGAQESFRKGTHESKQQPAYGAEARLNIFNGGRDRLDDARRDLIAERKGFEKDLTVAEELGKARELYWKIVYLHESGGLLKEARELNQGNLKSAVRRIRAGIATEADRVEFEMKDVDLKRDIEQTDLALRTHRKMLASILGLDGTDFVVTEKLHHEHRWEESLKHDHREHDFLVKPTELASEEMRLEARSVGRSFWPKVDAFAAWTQHNEREEEFSEPADRRESVIGLRLSMNLFDGFESRREAAALRAEADAAAAHARFLKREVEIHIESEMDELKLLHAQVHEAEDNIKRAARYYALTQSEYSRGVKNSPDVLGASEKLFDMKLKHLAIVRDFQLAKSHVLTKIGK